MIDSKVVKLQIHTSKTDIIPLTNPVLIRNKKIITGIGFYKLGSINVRDDGGSFVLEDLTSFGVIPVIVAVEEVPDGGVCDPPDLCQHLLRVINIHGVNDHDALAGDHEHGDDEPVRGETVDVWSHFSALRNTSSTITFLSLYQRMSRDMTK